jgi:NADPH:quinone reductase-like Zn-dependent oxidoreductase
MLKLSSLRTSWKALSGGLHGVCPCAFPYTPGFDVVGTVSAVGDGVTALVVGDSVLSDLGLTETCCDPPPAAGRGSHSPTSQLILRHFCP